ncbi:bZIP transcription factor 50 [Lathyrus oleraceus]|uniref:BZIP domain-containing protein n=1 Tax=Pisum sativum TaxID=3888 RepID=A0A9D4W9P8_PEA|nr:bZIP transcription factor 50 [Pisum sativum]KAI5396880.1 hypothetical protein KIW84_062929 [Pisum sativum]
MDVVDWESILDDLPELEVADFFQDGIIPPDSFADHPSPNSSMSQLENLLMTDFDNGEGIASPESDYDKLLEEILVQPLPQSEESLTPSDKDRVDPLTPEEVPHEPVSKKQIRQMRNRDAAVKSRERKKMYVKNLESKSRFFEGECRRLEHLLQCCYAENHALRLCLQSRGAFGASMTMQESAVLLLESLLLGSLLWFMGIMCQLSLPLLLWLTVLPPRENVKHKGLRSVALKRPNSNIKYFLTQSFVKSRRCQASRTKMKDDKDDFIVF